MLGSTEKLSYLNLHFLLLPWDGICLQGRLHHNLIKKTDGHDHPDQNGHHVQDDNHDDNHNDHHDDNHDI